MRLLWRRRCDLLAGGSRIIELTRDPRQLRPAHVTVPVGVLLNTVLAVEEEDARTASVDRAVIHGRHADGGRPAGDGSEETRCERGRGC